MAYGLVALWPCGLTSMRRKPHLFSSRARLAWVASDVHAAKSLVTEL